MENFTFSLNENNSIKEGIDKASIACFNGFINSIALKVLMTVAYSVVMGTSIVGNTMLAFAYYKSKNMRNTVNCCIMNMVVADLLLAFVYMPRMVGRIFGGLEWLVGGTPGLVLCKVVSISQEISICVSILTVVVIAFERFFAVAFPLRVIISTKLSIGLLCGTWLVSLAARSPMFYSVKTVRFRSGELGCLWIRALSFPTNAESKFYHQFMLVAFYGLPLLCIITLYTAIVIFLRRRQALIDNITRQRVLATNKKVTRMILAVITAFLLFWLLYFLVVPLHEFWNESIPCEVQFLRFFLGHINSACNPIICFVFSENYRNMIKIRRGKPNWKKPGRNILPLSPSRDRSRSNIELLSIRTLELDESCQHFRGTLNPGFKDDETALVS